MRLRNRLAPIPHKCRPTLALAEIEEQTPAHIYTLVKDLIAFLQQNDMEIAEEAVGMFADSNPESPMKVEGD